MPTVAIVRRALGVLCLAAAALGAAGAVRAHRFDASLPEPAADAPAALGPDVGDRLPFEPFAFAVVGAPHGDSAALVRALDAASRDAHLAFAVVHGDALPHETRRLAPFAAALRREIPVVVLAGPHDVWPADADARLAALAQPVVAFAFTSRGCTFRGGDVSATPRGDDIDAAAPADFTFTRAMSRDDTSHVFPPPPTDATSLAYEVVRVTSPTTCTRTLGRVARGPSLASLWNDLTLGVLRPFAAAAAGRAAALAAAFLLACAGVALLRPRASA